MIVYQRALKKEDFDIKKDEELIFYKNSNIAFIITKANKSFFIRKYKIFNNQLLYQKILKTIAQVIKTIN